MCPYAYVHVHHYAIIVLTIVHFLICRLIDYRTTDTAFVLHSAIQKQLLKKRLITCLPTLRRHLRAFRITSSGRDCRTLDNSTLNVYQMQN